MTDPEEPQSDRNQSDAAEVQQEPQDVDSELRADGGEAVSADPTVRHWLNGHVSASAPSNEDQTVQETSNSGQQTAGDTDALGQSNTHDQFDRTILEPFEELCGRLERMHRTDTDLVVTLSSGTLCYPLETKGARVCERKLDGREGTWVTILRTPDPEAPILMNRAGNVNSG